MGRSENSRLFVIGRTRSITLKKLCSGRMGQLRTSAQYLFPYWGRQGGLALEWYIAGTTPLDLGGGGE